MRKSRWRTYQPEQHRTKGGYILSEPGSTLSLSPHPLLKPSSLGMLVHRFASLAFAAITLFGQSVTAQERCSDPSVRREWRSLTPHERAEWIAAVKVNPSEHGSRITNICLPSAFIRYLTTRLWCRLLTQPTPQFHPLTLAVRISTVRLYPVFSQTLLASYRNRLGLCPHGSQSRCKSLLDPPIPRTMIQHKLRSTPLASSCPGIVRTSRTLKPLFKRNADTPALNRTGTGHSVWSLHVNPTSLTFMTDVSNFQNSTFWDPDTTSGVGGWGDPNDDDQITDGAFAGGFIVSYPLPHKLRRRYKATKSSNPDEPLTDEFTPESQLTMVNGFQGDFSGFQAWFAPGSHTAIHFIVGGCVNLPNRLRLRLLTDPTQRPFWDLSVHRSCRLHRRS